jgi:large subunit ribosomal protein L29
MKDTVELKNMTNDELQTKLLSLRKEQFTLRMKKSNGSLDKTHLIKQVRRTIAQVKTMITEKGGN